MDKIFSILNEIAGAAAQSAAYDQWTPDFCKKELKEVWGNLESPMRRKRNITLTVLDLQNLPKDVLLLAGFCMWDDKLLLVPLWIFNYIANGEVLTCINGRDVIKGTDNIDLDVRNGCTAYGFLYQ